MRSKRIIVRRLRRFSQIVETGRLNLLPNLSNDRKEPQISRMAADNYEGGELAHPRSIPFASGSRPGWMNLRKTVGE